MRPDSTVRRFVIAQAVAKNADGSLCQKVLQKRDDWGTADGAAAGPPASLTGFDFLDNGDVRLHNTTRTIITKAGPPNAYFTGLSRTFPLSVIQLEWGGTDRSDVELDRIKIWLNPRVNGALNRQVTQWKLELFALADEIQLQNVVKHQLIVIPLGAPVVVPVTNDAEGLVTFDFSGLVARPRPKFFTHIFTDNRLYGTFRQPTTFFVITALDKDGNGATNVGLGYDNSVGTLISAGNILSSRSISAPFSSAFWGADNNSLNGVPIVTIESGTYASTTIVFATNPPNLGGAPVGDVQLRLQGNVPTGCGLVGQVRNDADSAWITFTDGQWMTADLGLTPTQSRKMQVQLNTDASLTQTPTLTGLGMECFTETNFIRQTKISGGSWAVDPHSMRGQIPEILLTFIRDGDRDYADAITELLANNHIGDLRFRLYWGDETLNRKDWLNVDDLLIDGSHPGRSSIQLKCLTPLCLLRDNVPRYKPGSVFAPTSDTLVGAWTTEAGVGANLYSRINEATFDDPSYIRSELDPINSACEVKLPTITDPVGRRHILNYRYRKDATSGEQIDLTVELRQGGSIVVQDVVTNIDTDSAGSATPRSIVLTDAQVATITDYTNLRVRFKANKPSGSGSRRAIITWVQLQTGGRTDQTTYNTTLKATYDGLLASELGIDQRYRGQGVEDIQSQNQVGKTMFQTSGPTAKPIGKTELDAIAYIAGGGIISSQGKICYRDMFSTGPIRAIFPSSEIRLQEAGPGFEERMPQLFVQWKWNAAKGDFDRQEYVVHAGALLHLGKSRLDPPAYVDQETAKWLSNEGLDSNGLSLAGRIGVRQVQAIGPGLMLWKFTSNYRHPELEPGDIISLQTDKFVGRDPVANRAIRGQLWVSARIQSCDVDAQTFTAWVQSYSDMLATNETSERLGLGPATPHIMSVTPDVADSGIATAIIACNAATAVRIAVSTSAEPSAATVRAAALQNLDAAGVLRTGTLATLVPGQTLYIAVLAYEKVDGSGLESPLVAAQLAMRWLPTLSVLHTGPIWRGNRLTVHWDGNTGVASVKVATSTVSFPAAGTGTSQDGSENIFDCGTFLYGDMVYVTITPYSGAGATGNQGPALQYRTRLGWHDKMFDDVTGKVFRSTALAPQGSIVPTPADPSILLYKAAGPATGRMYGILRRLSNYTFRLPDQSSVIAPATNSYSRPAAPTLGQVSGGALGSRTRWVRVFYLKFLPRSSNNIWIIYRTSAESSFVISANNLLKVTAPATIAGYDGWGLMVGSASNGELFQRSSVDAVPFGTDWTEPVGGADLVNGAPYDALMDDGLTIEGLAASTNYQLYVYFDATVDTPAGGAFRIGASLGGGIPTVIDTSAAADQNGDGVIPLSFGVSVVLPVPVGSGSNSGNGGGSPKYQ